MGHTRPPAHALRRHVRSIAKIIVALAALAAVLVPGAAAQTGSSAVSIPDSSLRGAVEGALSKQSGETITADDMARLFTLDARYAGISRLDGLQHAVNLHTLYLQGNSVSSTSSLTNLTRLQILFLQYNDISEIDVTNMSDLRFLNLGYNDLTTIDLSSQRTRAGSNGQTIDSRLYALWLPGNRLASFDLSGLTALDDRSETTSDPSLVSLRLDGNRLNSVTGIEALPDEVQSLRLEDNWLTSVDLTGAEHLHYLYLDRNPISSTADIAGLSALTGLKRLHLYGTDISSVDLSPFSKLERAFLNDNSLTAVDVTGLDLIERLWLRGNQISTITGLEDIGDTLRSLNLRTNRLASIDVSDLTNLRHLYLSDNALTSIDVSALTRLEILWLHNREFSGGGDPPDTARQNRITALGQLPSSLTDLRIAGNPLTEPVSVASRTALTKLYVSGGQIAGLSEVQRLTGLTELGLTDVTLADADLPKLSRLSSLRRLNLNGNLIGELSLLPSFAELTELRLNDNDIVDVSPLSDMAALDDLYVAGNHIEDFSPLDSLVAGGLTIHGENDQTTGVPEEHYWDVDAAGSVHGRHLRLLAADDVMDNTECNTYLICPTVPIERWAVAVWLVRVLDGENPEPVGFNRFEDVHPGLQWAVHVERLAELGVTTGCTADPLRYCPHDELTRAQLASLLVRAFDVPSGPAAGFVDVPADDVHAADIDALAATGITQGCRLGSDHFCPDDQVTRAQTATFVSRAREFLDQN